MQARQFSSSIPEGVVSAALDKCAPCPVVKPEVKSVGLNSVANVVSTDTYKFPFFRVLAVTNVCSRFLCYTHFSAGLAISFPGKDGRRKRLEILCSAPVVLASSPFSSAQVRLSLPGREITAARRGSWWWMLRAARPCQMVSSARLGRLQLASVPYEACKQHVWHWFLLCFHSSSTSLMRITALHWLAVQPSWSRERMLSLAFVYQSSYNTPSYYLYPCFCPSSAVIGAGTPCFSTRALTTSSVNIGSQLQEP